jgi:ATP-dependent exoDNAse (exonuclease V) alpha subunit
MKPECPLDADTLPIIEDCLLPLISTVNMAEQGGAFQLDRYVQTSKLISETIAKRKNGNANEGDFDWAALVHHAIDGDRKIAHPTKDDLNARKEKAAALEVLYRSRISVLMGSAGTGKSTLLKALCNIDSVRNLGILLLAPTGKARVRLEQTSGMPGQGRTVAQFLNKLQRYDGGTGRYYINSQAETSSAHKTVVIDECSMLTEEQLAALLDAVRGVERLILVGDSEAIAANWGRATVCRYREILDARECRRSLSTSCTLLRGINCHDARDSRKTRASGCVVGERLQRAFDGCGG